MKNDAVLQKALDTYGIGNQTLMLFEEMAELQNALCKLTPRECFRLMDVDDADIDKIQAAGISKSRQYKMAGNSIVVSCLYHIFRKMFVDTATSTPTQLSLF